MTVKSEQEFEKELQAKGLTEKRLTPKDIDELIDSVLYHVFEDTTTTVCCIKLTNGFTVIGESACVDPKNFDKYIGQSIAYNEARQKIWSLEGYLLRDRMHNQSDKSVGAISEGEKMFRKIAQDLDIDLKGHPLDEQKDVVPHEIMLPNEVLDSIAEDWNKQNTEHFLIIDEEKLQVVGVKKGYVEVVPYEGEL